MALYLQGAANAANEKVFAQILVPTIVGGRSLNATTASQRIARESAATAMVITNPSTETLFFKFGNGTVTVSPADFDWQFIVPGNERRAVGIPSSATHLAFVGTGSASFYLEQH
jgi:hypothetical protein